MAMPRLDPIARFTQGNRPQDQPHRSRLSRSYRLPRVCSGAFTDVCENSLSCLSVIEARTFFAIWKSAPCRAACIKRAVALDLAGMIHPLAPLLSRVTLQHIHAPVMERDRSR